MNNIFGRVFGRGGEDKGVTLLTRNRARALCLNTDACLAFGRVHILIRTARASIRHARYFLREPVRLCDPQSSAALRCFDKIRSNRCTASVFMSENALLIACKLLFAGPRRAWPTKPAITSLFFRTSAS
jgi:hypothetical protein